MILIFSEDQDKSTSDVIDWLIKLQIKFIRINEDSVVEISNICFSNEGNLTYKLIIDNVLVSNSNIKGVWFRRGDFKPNFGYNYHDLDNSIEENYNIKLFSNRQTRIEHLFLRNYILTDIFSKKNLNTIFNAECNKLLNLKIASEYGIKCPQYIITGKKIELKKFYIESDGDVITKFISPGFASMPIDFQFINPGTVKITSNIIEKLPEDFQPTFFQKQIEKHFELRIFFINLKFYAEAIFSQNDTKTSIDFRHYNSSKPNRTVPFKLPEIIEEKLKLLTEKIKINCGSIDLIYSKNKEYFFLEINPLGQFWQVSYPCNYYIEKEIADFFNI